MAFWTLLGNKGPEHTTAQNEKLHKLAEGCSMQYTRRIAWLAFMVVLQLPKVIDVFLGYAVLMY
jgi:hypothetical protein